jgi:formylglycine-generating enzyme required for sulfatase activity
MTHPVAQKQANAFGLYDMSGNVWEWVEDSWHDNYNGAPTDGSVWQGDGAKRVLRGGSWNSGPQGTLAAYRIMGRPAEGEHDVGFRLARTLP